MKNHLNYILLPLFILLSVNQLFARYYDNPDAIIGIFKNPDDGRQISIYKEGNLYFGKLVALPASDNARAKIGTVLLKNFSYKSGEWHGQIYLPARAAEYKASLSMPDLNTLTIKVKAGLLSQTRTWVRVAQPIKSIPGLKTN